MDGNSFVNNNPHSRKKCYSSRLTIMSVFTLLSAHDKDLVDTAYVVAYVLVPSENHKCLRRCCRGAAVFARFNPRSLMPLLLVWWETHSTLCSQLFEVNLKGTTKTW